MGKTELAESITPCSGQYSFQRDLRLNAWLLVAVVCYLGQAMLLSGDAARPAWLRVSLAVSPLVPTLLYIRAWVRFVRGLDELQRRIQVSAHLFAVWGTLLVSVVLTILNEQEIVDVLPHGLGFAGVPLVLFPLWLIGLAIANCRYR